MQEVPYGNVQLGGEIALVACSRRMRPKLRTCFLTCLGNEMGVLKNYRELLGEKK